MCTYPIYMCTYPIQQQKQEREVSFPKCPFLYVYIPSTKTLAQTQRIVSKMPSLTFVHTLFYNTNINRKYRWKVPSLTCAHTLYNNKNINKKDCSQNKPSYKRTYPVQKSKHNKKSLLFPKWPVLHVYIPSTTRQKKLAKNIPINEAFQRS